MCRTRLSQALMTGLIVLGTLYGCAAAPPPDAQTTQTPPETGQPALNSASNEVLLYTTSTKFVVNDFRIDLPKMKNVYYLYGFYPDQWERMEQVPFSAIREFQIRDVVDDISFDRIYKTREDFQLNQQEIFKVVVTSMNGDTFDFIAIIPKVRGWRDGQRWELPMAGNPQRIDRVVLSS
jgi:hypothetical protein